MRRGLAIGVVSLGLLAGGVLALHSGMADGTQTRDSLQAASSDARMKNASRRAPVNGWTQVHLEGTPGEIGYQHGVLLAPEIEDLKKVFVLELAHDTGKDWNFFRNEARDSMWPHIDGEYREEMQGIADGAKARGVNVDVWDIVAMNADEEWSYFVEAYDKAHAIPVPATVVAPDHCSAFVATGKYTKDGRIVIAHNNWTNYLDGARWTMVFDIVPTKGYRILMD